MTAKVGGAKITYAYDASGMRASKTAGGTKTEYTYAGKRLARINKGGTKAQFLYDVQGRVSLMKTGDAYYTYVYNLQGDVIALLDSKGSTVVEYAYDAWGKQLGEAPTGVGLINPFRYRGYVYDDETGLYYLESRYYNPEWGRFISVDSVLGKVDRLFSHNLYAYCTNNPVMKQDPDGCFALTLTAIGIGIGKFLGGALIYAGSKLLVDAIYESSQSAYAYSRNKDRTKTRILSDVRARNEPMGKYYLAYVSDYGDLVKFGDSMDIVEAAKKLGVTAIANQINRHVYDTGGPTEARDEMKKMGRENWGIYTHDQRDAKALALMFGCNTPPEVHGVGYYGHYHDIKHIFHIWYGGKLN